MCTDDCENVDAYPCSLYTFFWHEFVANYAHLSSGKTGNKIHALFPSAMSLFAQLFIDVSMSNTVFSNKTINEYYSIQSVSDPQTKVIGQSVCKAGQGRKEPCENAPTVNINLENLFLAVAPNNRTVHKYFYIS